MLPTRRFRASLVVVVTLVASMLAFQAPADAAATGKVRGGIYGAHGTTPKVVMQWFTKDWTYLGKRKQTGGSYSLTLPPGTYWIQFVDQRPAYDVTKAAPTNIKVTVRAGRTVTKSVRMRPGAAITGTVQAGGKVAKGARVVAANASEQSFEVKANGKGQFALGGLPAGSYSVFTYDRTKKFVGKSLWVPGLKPGRASNVAIRLTKPAGRLLVDLYAGDQPITKRVNVTVVSKANGQFWSANAKHGSASFQGLFPGRYKIVVPGVGSYLASTGSVHGGVVRPGKVAFGSYRLTKRGASVSGVVVDAKDPSYPLSGAQVLLFDKTGAQRGSTTTNGSGEFSFAGQLTTQGGMTVVAQPGAYSPYLGQTTHYCKYGKFTTGAFSITTGRDADLGSVPLPHLPAAQQDQEACWP